ncbi:MAG: hypothetical protein LLG97_06425 [Deltaproteobacteria bacterium]|nr:hypothetical protein [Deltaproteobacteria bacterium]
MSTKTAQAEEGSIPLPPDAGGGKRRPRREFFGALFLMAISAAFIVEALRMPFKDPSWEWYTSPNIFPLSMAVCLGTCALFVACRGLIGWLANKEAIGPLRLVEGGREWGMGRFLAGATMIAVLIFLLGKINFYILAPSTIMVFGVVFRSHPLAKALKSSLIASAFILAFLYIISRIFGIVFP